MTVKCYIRSFGKSEWNKIGEVEITCSEQMADYLETVTDEQCEIKPNVRDDHPTNWMGLEADTSVKDTIRIIANKTLDIGDKLISDNFSVWNSFYFRRKDYDFKYQKTVVGVKDRYVTLVSNKGKEFVVQMNDYLYLMDRPKISDLIEVTVFLNGQSFVTRIIEKYEPPTTLEKLKQKKKFLELNCWDVDEKIAEINRQIKEIEDNLDEFDELIEDY